MKVLEPYNKLLELQKGIIMRRIIILTFAFIFSNQLVAETLTAVCKDPSGRLFGQHGTMGKNQAVDETDGMKGGLVTITWKSDEGEAQIITQGSGGGKPLQVKGFRVLTSDEQLSFIVIYPAAVWLYSLFPKPSLLLMTSHVNGLSIDSGGAINKSMKAKCDISIK